MARISRVRLDKRRLLMLLSIRHHEVHRFGVFMMSSIYFKRCMHFYRYLGRRYFYLRLYVSRCRTHILFLRGRLCLQSSRRWLCWLLSVLVLNLKHSHDDGVFFLP